MYDTLAELRETSDSQRRKHLMQELHQLLNPADRQTQDETEDNRMDFVMEDGFQVVCSAIRQRDMGVDSLRQGFQILDSVAEDTACHWQSIWKALGGLVGVISLLEDHSAESFVVYNVLRLLYKMASFQLLRLNPKDIFRHIVLWDLLLMGMENQLEDKTLFETFCEFLGSERITVPCDLQRRVSFCVERGIFIHSRSCSVHYLKWETILSKLNESVTTDGKKTHSMKHSTRSTNSLVPCSAAA